MDFLKKNHDLLKICFGDFEKTRDILKLFWKDLQRNSPGFITKSSSRFKNHGFSGNCFHQSTIDQKVIYDDINIGMCKVLRKSLKDVEKEMTYQIHIYTWSYSDKNVTICVVAFKWNYAFAFYEQTCFLKNFKIFKIFWT